MNAIYMDTSPTASQFEWLTLEDDEEILWSDTSHRFSLVPAFIVGIPLCLILIGIPIVISAYLSHTNTRYVVTTAALYTKTGVLSRNVQRIEFGKVQNTSYQQSALGSSFGFGTVDISTAGGGGIEMRFRNVSDPRGIQTLINERIQENRSRNGSESDEGDTAAVLDEIVTELQAIRRILEDDGGTARSDTDVRRGRGADAIDNES